jgi:hypothetical protein
MVLRLQQRRASEGQCHKPLRLTTTGPLPNSPHHLGSIHYGVFPPRKGSTYPLQTKSSRFIQVHTIINIAIVAPSHQLFQHTNITRARASRLSLGLKLRPYISLTNHDTDNISTILDLDMITKLAYGGWSVPILALASYNLMVTHPK